MEEHVFSLLPIGTVVSIQGSQKRLMIFGILQNPDEEEDANIHFDYAGVPYPEGNIGPEYQVLFNHQDVEQVYFRGFEDIERQHFIKGLAQQDLKFGSNL